MYSPTWPSAAVCRYNIPVKISSAEFWAAATQLQEVPAPRRPEIAVAGRSNVGKSSLINALARRKRLARTSQTPGCTRGIIFFDINQRLTLVDLPGYGWAQRSREERARWKRLVEGYLDERSALAGVALLVDLRRGPEQQERQLAEYLDARGIRRVWVLTKCDKLKRSKLAARLGELERELAGDVLIVTSAHTGSGIDGVRYWMENALKAHRENGG